MSYRTNFNGDDWYHVEVSRVSRTQTHAHTCEEFEGVLFVSHRVYGTDGRLESITLTRADLVHGSIPESDSAP